MFALFQLLYEIIITRPCDHKFEIKLKTRHKVDHDFVIKLKDFRF